MTIDTVSPSNFRCSIENNDQVQVLDLKLLKLKFLLTACLPHLT